MKDPYKILGVPRDATEEQIKEAYRELAKKYHPDKYINNPLADLAAEKMRDINEAYDSITKNKGSADSRDSYNNYSSDFNASGGSAQFASIRKMINENRIEEADRALNESSVRNAEWHFLMGVVKERMGWHDMAFQHIARAVQLDPYNTEYQNAFNAFNMRRSAYTRSGDDYGYGTPVGCCSCDSCSTLLCADCCCELMGGDLIRCC